MFAVLALLYMYDVEILWCGSPTTQYTTATVAWVSDRWNLGRSNIISARTGLKLSNIWHTLHETLDIEYNYSFFKSCHPLSTGLSLNIQCLTHLPCYHQWCENIVVLIKPSIPLVFFCACARSFSISIQLYNIISHRVLRLYGSMFYAAFYELGLCIP